MVCTILARDLRVGERNSSVTMNCQVPWAMTPVTEEYAYERRAFGEASSAFYELAREPQSSIRLTSGGRTTLRGLPHVASMGKRFASTSTFCRMMARGDHLTS